MRISSDVALLDVPPGGQSDFAVDVVNTGAVIDGVTARVVGLPEHLMTSRPAVLPLFPDSSGRLTLTLGLPAGFPAGRHPVTVEVRSRQIETGPEYLDLDVVVPSLPALGLSSRPQVVRTRRTARYVLVVANRGNTPLDITLAATDPERSVATTMQPGRLSLAPATTGEVVLTARGPRMIFGAELDRAITVTATGRPYGSAGSRGDANIGTTVPVRLPSPAPPSMVPGSPIPQPPTAPGVPGVPDPAIESAGPEETSAEPLTATCPLTLRQRPWLTRGLLTALILLAIIAGWAAVFLFGLNQVFAGDPITKTAQASFFQVPGQVTVAEVTAELAVSSAAAATEPAGGGSSDGGSSDGGSGGGGSGGSGGGAPPMPAPVEPAVPPAGALPKDGTLPSGLAGSITGTVTATSSGQPVGRILVTAVRVGTDGPTEVASAATQDDGSYQVSGLFPGDYFLQFSADGFDEIWFPAAPAMAGAEPITAVSAEITTGKNVVIVGKPATVTGTVDPGDTTAPVVTKVTVAQLSGTVLGEPVGKPVETNAQNAYTIDDLPAPGTYQLTFEAEGYTPTTVRVDVGGGTRRLQPTVALKAGAGSISGVVTDGTQPLGGITVTTTVGGAERSIGTPTTGATGTFTLGDLPTPATYVITFSGKGFGTTSESIDLAPGQNRELTEDVALTKGVGTVTGILVDDAGAGLGGATVTVGGGTDLPTASTLTNGTVGAFTLTGLPDPGTYTLTFSLDGYADVTVPLTLPMTEPTLPPVVMSSAGGTISGVVTSGGQPLVGATVVATDGVQSWPVTSTAASGGFAAGSYVITGLPAGSYTVTATGPSGVGRTALVAVAAGATTAQNFTVPGAG